MAPTVPSRRPPGRLASLKGGPPKRRGPPKKPAAAAKNECPNCKSTELEETDGLIVCKQCYQQVGESNIVAEVTFEENAGGRATVQGGTVNDNSRHARTLNSATFRKIGGGERNSMADAQQAGKKALEAICPKLGVESNVKTQAESIWIMAAGINFSAGRRTDEVVAACLYAACRRQKENNVLLMDIAEYLKINVFRLGEVYKDLCKELYLNNESVGNQNLVELEPLIFKYCQKLQFGDKTKDVSQDALRIIKRMNRDWIVSGRHPAGLCGACIILAARMNNFQRSVREVVYVSKVADITIAKRVEEFRRTKSAGLNVTDFRNVALKIKHQHDPPSVYLDERKDKIMARRRAKREEHVRMSVARRSEGRESQPINIQDGATDASSRLSSLVPGTPAPDAPPSAQQQAPVAQMVAPQMTPPATQETQAQSTTAEWSLGPPIPQLTPPATQESNKRKSPEHDDTPNDQNKRQRTGSEQQTAPGLPPGEVQPPLRIDADGYAIPALPVPVDAPAVVVVVEEEEPAPPPKRGRGRPKKVEPPPIDISREELDAEDYLELQIEQALKNGEVQESMSEVEKVREDEEREKRIAEEAERARLLAEKQQKIDTDKIKARREARGQNWWGEAPEWSPGEILTAEELEKEFANDPEVGNCLLDADEVRIKEQIWVAHNEDWLRKQAERDLLAKTQKANGGNKPGRKSKKGDKIKKKRSKMGDGSVLTESNTPIETPADAARAMLEKRAPQKSAHVDFSALQRIYGRETPSRASSSSPDDSGTPSREQSRNGSESPGPSEPDDRGAPARRRRSSASAQAGDQQEPAAENDPWAVFGEDPPREDEEEEAADFNKATDEFGALQFDNGSDDGSPQPYDYNEDDYGDQEEV
ncbi:Transcription factor IIIB subunit [Fulvia fulva]|nr:Transcription factor IIIB subunit [Fulvia fulva]WPV17700.1 Transcription factor IIIB subunit [Fulvia fulva]